MKTIKTRSLRTGHERDLTVCGEDCPAPAVIRGNPDRLAHFVIMINSFSSPDIYPRGENASSQEELASEWIKIHEKDPTTIRAAVSGAAVCAACDFRCQYEYRRQDGNVLQSHEILKLAL